MKFLILVATLCSHLIYAQKAVSSTIPAVEGAPTFLSRPDLISPVLDVVHHQPGVSEGHIFIAPYFTHYPRPDAGPYIFDTSGSLIWSGVDDAVSAKASSIHGLQICKYQGKDHLCFWRGRQKQIYGSGVGVIMNEHYQVVKTVQSPDAGFMIDLHEFRLITEHTALVTIYKRRFIGSMWVLDCVFREVSIEDGEVLFEWSAMEHIELSESRVSPGSAEAIGDGYHPDTAWDFFHINSIDKTAEGDYIISSRHTDGVFKISRLDGSILWRLNGDKSSFNLLDFTFQRQHHASVLDENPEYTTLSLFDNDNDGIEALGNNSMGMVIQIDHLKNTANKIAEYKPPTVEGLGTDGMGSIFFLSKGNALVSWGTDAAMVEYLPDGTPVWSASTGWMARNYRVHKAKWTGKPLQPPALWSFAESPTSPTTAYVSWNGATEVLQWRFYAAEDQEGPFEILGTKPKKNFETDFSYATHKPWTFVEAVGKEGSLGKSTVVRTFVLDNNTVFDLEPPAAHPIVTLADSETESPLNQESCLVTDRKTTSFTSYHISTSVDVYLYKWRYLEHFMALAGSISLLGLALGLLYKSFRMSIQYHRLSVEDFDI